MFLGPHFISHTNNSRWTADLNVKGETIELLEKKTEEHPCDPGIGKDFINKTQKDPTINKETKD